MDLGRAFIITVFVYGYALMKRVEKIERNVAAALPAVPIDNKQERDAIRARLRRKYADLKPLKVGMSAEERRRFEELGELMDKLDACESRPPETRST